MRRRPPTIWSSCCAAPTRRWPTRLPSRCGRSVRPHCPSCWRRPNDEAPAVRRRAVTAIGQLGPAAATSAELLLPLTSDAHAEVRAAALEALVRVAPALPATTQALLTGLRDSDASVQQAAASNLLRADAAAQDALADLVELLDAEPPTAATAAFVLGRLGSLAEPAIPPLLTRVMERHDPMAAGVLSRIGLPAVDALLQCAAQQQLEAEQVGDILGEMGPRAHARLLQELAHESAPRRAAVLLALGRSRVAEAAVVSAIGTGLEDPSVEVRAAAAAALGRLGVAAAAAQPALLRATSDSDPLVRANSLTALLAIGVPAEQILPPILAGLQDANGQVRRESADALGHLRPFPSAALEPLIAALADAEAAVRSSAASALGQSHGLGKGAVEPLVARLADEQADVRGAAILALGQIGPEAVAAVPALVQSLEQAAAADQCDILRALGGIGVGAADAAATVQQRLQSSDPLVRAAAVDALAKIMEPSEPLVMLLMRAWRIRSARCVNRQPDVWETWGPTRGLPCPCYCKVCSGPRILIWRPPRYVGSMQLRQKPFL